MTDESWQVSEWCKQNHKHSLGDIGDGKNGSIDTVIHMLEAPEVSAMIIFVRILHTCFG